MRQKSLLTTNVAANFYINVTLISPCCTPGVLYNPVWDIPYNRQHASQDSII